jgi:hypothetical protein
MAAQQLHDGNSDGVSIAAAATEKVGFFGATPVVQAVAITDATDATTAIAKVNAVIAALEAYGLLAE